MLAVVHAQIMTKSPTLIRDWNLDYYSVRLYRHNETFYLPDSNFDFLYNSPQYLYSQPITIFHSFYLFKKEKEEVIAFIHFNLNEQESSLVSQNRAPFGGIEVRKSTSSNAISFLLQCVNDWAVSIGLKSISIKIPSNCYYLDAHQNHSNHYLSNNYSVTNNQINHAIPVSATPFDKRITNSEKRRLQKCQRSGFEVRGVNELPLEETYQFLSKARADKDYPLNVSLETLQNLAIRFSKKVITFAVFDSNKIIAATIAIRASESVLYNFLPATATDYANFSPTVLLTETVYQYCQQHGIVFLDLGTSCDHHGLPKPSLLKFKENLGGIAFKKLTFTHYL